MSEFEGGFSGGSGVSSASTVSPSFNGNESSGNQTGLSNNSPNSSHEMFKNLPSHSESKPIIDVSHGKSDNKMFDITKPIRQEPITQHSTPVNNPKNQEEPIIDIHNCKKERSMVSFPPENKMVDISKPYDSTSKEEAKSTPHEEIEKVEFKNTQQAEKEDLKGKNTHSFETKINPYQNTYPLWQKIDNDSSTQSINFEAPSQQAAEKPEVKLNTTAYLAEKKSYEPSQKLDVNPIVETSSKVQNQPKPFEKTQMVSGEPGKLEPKVQNHQDVKRLKEVRTEILPQTTMQELVKIRPGVKTETRERIFTDLNVAQTEVLPELSRESVDITEVKKTLVMEIQKQNERDISVSENIDIKKLPKSKYNSLEEKAKVMFQKRKSEKELVKNGSFGKEQPESPRFLFMVRDEAANSYRKMATTLNASRLFFEKKGEAFTGQELASQVSQNLDNGTSEIVKGIQKDVSLDDFVEGISKVGKMQDLTDVERALEQIVRKITAVRISFRGKGEEIVKRNDAKRVYRHELDEVEAKVEEDNSRGKIIDDENGQLSYVVGSKKPYGVVLPESKDEEMDIS